MSHFAVEDPELAGSHKEGFLSKRSKNARFYSQWNRHWFKMSNHWLHYYFDQWERPPPLCAYDLRAMSDVLMNSDPKSKEFKLVSAGSTKKSYHFRAESREDAKDWVKKLEMRLNELRSSKNSSIQSPGRFRGFLNIRRAADKGLLSANLLQVIHVPSKRRWCQIEYDSKLRCRTFCVYENRQHEKVGSREGIAAGHTMMNLLSTRRKRSDSPLNGKMPILKMVLRTVTFEEPEDPESLEFLLRTSKDPKHVWIVNSDSRVHLEDWIISIRAYGASSHRRVRASSSSSSPSSLSSIQTTQTYPPSTSLPKSPPPSSPLKTSNSLFGKIVGRVLMKKSPKTSRVVAETVKGTDTLVLKSYCALMDVCCSLTRLLTHSLTRSLIYSPTSRYKVE
jgi:hypothetical protein